MSLSKGTVFVSALPNAYDAEADDKMLGDGKAPAKPFPLTEETTCGIGCIRGPLLQRFANKKAYVILYGIVGCIFAATYAYFNGIITTLEKRYRIPSKTMGVITVGNDISTLLISAVLSYYAGKGHRPRWIAFGVYSVVLFCLLNALPHFLYGPGEDALSLTLEYGGVDLDLNATADVMDRHNRQTLCQKSDVGVKCDTNEGNFAPIVILFLAQLISGVGGSLYYSLGVSYMDDNIKKSKTPALISFSYFIRMLGPAIGYTLASACLKFYISPTLTPKITNKDPRWLGAWWAGWLILAAIMFVFASLLGLFPKTLPRAAIRRALGRNKGQDQKPEADQQVSFENMLKTFRKLLHNRTLLCNNFAAIFYFLGYMPYWIFMPKYIETMYKQSSSSASLITGTVGLVFSACGILISGLLISKFKPRARTLAVWNVFVGFITVIGVTSYAFLGCPVKDPKGVILGSGELNPIQTCNENCHCDYVKYSPVCANGESYISACHAGCKNYQTLPGGSKIFTECSCAQNSTDKTGTILPAIATPGPCPSDCTTKFYAFLSIVCLLKFVGATGRASNFLVSVRCVDEEDKTVSVGFGMMLMSFFAFIPSPIIFGYIIDTTCLVWGKTCTGTGNCWLYNGEALRYILNSTAAVLVSIGTLFDFGVWYYVKDLIIFDEEVEMKSNKDVKDVKQ